MMERKRETSRGSFRYTWLIYAERNEAFESARGRALGSVGRARFSQPLLLSTLFLRLTFALRASLSLLLSHPLSFTLVHLHAHLHLDMYIYIYIYTYINTCIFVYLYVHVCMYVYICMCSLSYSPCQCFRRGVAGKGVSIICKRIRNA